MSQPVNADIIEVIFRKIQPESAPEILDSSLKLVPAQRSD